MNRLWLARLTPMVMLTALAARPAAAAQDCDVRGTVEQPTQEAAITSSAVVISGWAADVAAQAGTGVRAVRIALDADPDQDGVPVAAAYGWERPDIAELLGERRFLPSGFALTWDTTGVQPGQHTLHIQVQSACGWTSVTRTVLVAGRSSTSPSGATPTRTIPTSPPTATPTPTPPRPQP